MKIKEERFPATTIKITYTCEVCGKESVGNKSTIEWCEKKHATEAKQKSCTHQMQYSLDDYYDEDLEATFYSIDAKCINCGLYQAGEYLDSELVDPIKNQLSAILEKYFEPVTK